MLNRPERVAAELPVGRDDLESAQDNIQMAQQDLHDTLEAMIETLDAGNSIDPKLYQDAEEQMKQLEGEVGCLRTDLGKLKNQGKTSRESA